MEIKCFGFEGFTSGHYAAALPSCQATVWFFSSNVFGHYPAFGRTSDQQVCLSFWLAFLSPFWQWYTVLPPTVQCFPNNASEGLVTVGFNTDFVGTFKVIHWTWTAKMWIEPGCSKTFDKPCMFQQQDTTLQLWHGKHLFIKGNCIASVSEQGTKSQWGSHLLIDCPGCVTDHKSPS